MTNSSNQTPNLLTHLITDLNELTDYRCPSKIEYSLSEILFLVFCSQLCGFGEYEQMVDFGKMRLSWLRTYLPYAGGIPSSATLSRVLSILNTKELEKVLIGQSKLSFQVNTGQVIHIDGKRLRGSATKKEKQTKKSKGGKQAVHMVNVYCSDIEQCLASIRVSSKKAERSTLPEILSLLDLKGSLLTMDAFYCHKQVVEQVSEAGADYLITLKANQPNLLAAAQDLLSNCPAVETYHSGQEEGHGRIENRTCKVLNFSNLDGEYWQEYGELFKKWIGLKCLIMVTSERMVTRNKKKTTETRYFISSREQNAKKANGNVRGHWTIENCLNWVLDVFFDEDKSSIRKGKAAENTAIFKKIAFNKIKSFDDPDKVTSTPRKMNKCAMNPEYLHAVIQGI